MNNITLEDVGIALKQHKADIEKKIEDLKKEQTTSSDNAITELKKMLDEVKIGMAKYDEALKDAKSFGIPGLADDMAKGKAAFSISKFLLADYLMKAQGRGSSNPPAAVSGWDEAFRMADAQEEQAISKEYWQKRESVAMKSKVFTGDVKGYESDSGSLGGYLVPPEASSEVIGMTIANMPLLNMPGVRKITGLHGDLFVPKQTDRNIGYHVGETSKPKESTGAFGGTWLRPKKVGGFTKQSNRILYQSRGVSDTIIKQSLSDAISLEWHRGLLNGTGSDSEAKGLLQWCNEMTKTIDGTAALTALIGTSYRFRIDHAMQMQQALDNANELRDTGTYGYLMHPQAKWGMRRERVLQYSTQNESLAQPVDGMNILINDQRLRDILGYDFKTTTQMPKDTNSRTSVVFGDFSMFWSATFRDPIIRVSDVAGDGSTGSAFLQDQLYIVMFVEYDCAVMRPSAFSIISNAATLSSEW